jgi:hypothetical protein
MKIPNILVLALLAISPCLAPEPPAPEKKVYCKLANLFGGKGTTSPKKHESSTYCKTIKSTCCSEQDFKDIQKWWEDSQDKVSVVEQRAIEMRTLIGKFKLMEDYVDVIKTRVEKIKKVKRVGQPACVSPAHILGNIFELGLVKTAIRHFLESAKDCWHYTKDLMNGLMCSVCDAQVQDRFIMDKKLIAVSIPQCMEFSKHCLYHMKSLWALTHYLTYMNIMTKCTDDAQFKGKHEELIMSNSLIQAINSCLHEKNVDDCKEVCRQQFSFSTQVAYEHKNIEMIMRFLRNVDNEFGQEARRRKAEKEKEKKNKRLLEDERILDEIYGKRKADNDDPKKPDNGSTKEPMDEYGIQITFNGLNATNYTKNNSDGFETLNVSHIIKDYQSTILSTFLVLAFMIAALFN